MRTKWSYVYQKWSKDVIRPLSTSSNAHRSSSIIFHWWKMTSTWKWTGHLLSPFIDGRWPQPEEDIKMKINRNLSYQYPEQSKGDIRPFSTSSNLHRSSSIDVIDSIMETFWPGRLNLSQLLDLLISISKGAYLNPSSLMRTSTCETFKLPGQMFPFENQLHQWKMSYGHWKMCWKVWYHLSIALDTDNSNFC